MYTSLKLTRRANIRRTVSFLLSLILSFSLLPPSLLLPPVAAAAGPAAVVLGATKETVGAPLVAGQFNFGLYDEDGTLVSTAVNNAFGSVVFPTLTIDVEGVFEFTILELTPSGGGWTTDSSSFPVVVTVSDYGGANLSAVPYYPLGNPRFVNTYTDPATVIFTATKEAIGAPLVAGQFAFELIQVPGGFVSSATNTASGTIAFDPITFTDTGVFDFIIRESTPSGGGWTTDSREWPVTVTVTGGSGAYLSTPTYPEGIPHFVNTYAAADATVSIAGLTKTIAGPWAGGDTTFGFTATQTDSSGDPVSSPIIGTGSVTLSSGSVAFGFSLPDLSVSGSPYYFAVSEDNGGTTADGWTYSDVVHRVRIDVSDNGDGTSTASVTPLDSNTTFTNTYAVSDTSVDTWELYKGIEGPWTGGDKTFSFTAVQVDALGSDTVIGSAGGTQTATLSSSSIGFYVNLGPLNPAYSPYFFKITEDNGGTTVDGWTYDPNEYWCEVEVTDNSDGTSSAVVVAETIPYSWVNTYSVEATTVVIEGLSKTINDAWTAPSPTFDFTAVQVDALGSTTIIGPATGTASVLGSTAGLPFNLAIPGLGPSGSPYYFMITEDGGGSRIAGWTRSDNAYWVEVNVYDNHLGQSYYTVNYEGAVGSPDFTNTYSFDPLLIELIGTKKTVGAALGDKVFEFGIFYHGDQIATGKNDATGKIVFETLQVNEPGTYPVTIKETSKSAGGWTSDTKSFDVTIVVTDNGDGTMSAQYVYPAGGVVFTNTYTALATPSAGDRIGVIAWYTLVAGLCCVLIALAIDSRRTNPRLVLR